MTILTVCTRYRWPKTKYRSGKISRTLYGGSFFKHRHTRRSMLTRVGVMLNMQLVTWYSCQHIALDCKGLGNLGTDM